ncbi:MAG: peptide chain release factor 2 [Candidatus Omnitrophica bacterium]|nr:peptide chain release factor 2 [Candidatus Omnitrophota bacterium]
MKKSGGIFDLGSKETEIESLNEKMAQHGFWDRPTEAQVTVDQLKKLKRIIEPWQSARQEANDLKELIDLVERGDETSLAELEVQLKKLTHDVHLLEFQRLLSDPLDPNSAIISVNAGAGGTESCDWANMLFRMYTRYAEKSGFTIEMIDFLSGEEAGIKSATFFVKGPYAYGYLKAERGVHRLVRISPFDSNKRRHTSFASIDVIAEVEGIGEDFEIPDSELKIDTFRAGGAGGQHVNKTSSAVRITHIPTGIVVQCQNERSQLQNKQTAMKVLRARLYERKRREEEEKLKQQYGEKKEISWGSQIRSYVFHPYTLVKDHRTNYETSNGQAVMDGDLEEFVQAYLKKNVKK